MQGSGNSVVRFVVLRLTTVCSESRNSVLPTQQCEMAMLPEK
jgi:hypothetical protein